MILILIICISLLYLFNSKDIESQQTINTIKNLIKINYDWFILKDCIDFYPETYGILCTVIDSKIVDKNYFKSEFINNEKVCLIKNLTNDWKCMNTWSFEYFLKNYGECYFSLNEHFGTGDDINTISIKFKDYYYYMKNQRKYNFPLYIFDDNFVNRPKVKELLNDYRVSEYFTDDLYDLVKSPEKRTLKWLTIGPKGSGAEMHHDPYRTSTWNTVISGKKRWIVFPPKTFTDEILKEFRKEKTGIQWYVKYYHHFRHLDHYDIIQDVGDTLFLPGGWWHSVINLEDTIAVTHNFLPPHKFEKYKKRIKVEELENVYNELEIIHREKYI